MQAVHEMSAQQPHQQHSTITMSAHFHQQQQQQHQQQQQQQQQHHQHLSATTTTTNVVTNASQQPPPTLIDPNLPQAFCLRWNNYQFNLTSVFEQLLQNEQFVDVTLSCDGVSIKAHKVVLSACSPYFTALFNENPCKHPIIIMRDIRLAELKAIVEFMYRGEINVCQDQIGPLLRIAELLKIRGLADVSPDQRVEVETVEVEAPQQQTGQVQAQVQTVQQVVASSTVSTIMATNAPAPAMVSATMPTAAATTTTTATMQTVPATEVGHIMKTEAPQRTNESTTHETKSLLQLQAVTAADWNENITTVAVHQADAPPALLHSTATIAELTAVDVLVSAPLQLQPQQQQHSIVVQHQQVPIVVDVIQPAAAPTIASVSTRSTTTTTTNNAPMPSTSSRSTSKPHRKRKLLSDKTLESLLSDETTTTTAPLPTTTSNEVAVVATPTPTTSGATAKLSRGRKSAKMAAAAAAATVAAVAVLSAPLKVEQQPEDVASPSQQDIFRELVIDEELKANQLDNQSVADETVTRDETYESDGNQSTATSSACPTDSPTAKSFTNFLKLKAPTWSQQQLREAIHAVVTQKLRFTQASSRYNIPKGTLYDNILGKANRMLVLEESGLDTTAEKAVLEFCCDVSVSPYNRRTKKPLGTILEFVQQLSDAMAPDGRGDVRFGGKFGFRWWWAFCKKYSIVSLHYDGSVAATAASAALAALAGVEDGDGAKDEDEEDDVSVAE